MFYDGFEKVRLWGTDGAKIFADVFERKAGYVVMFISQAYVTKSWPQLEREAALRRMITEDREYCATSTLRRHPCPRSPRNHNL